jgi:hypothetical protein
MSDFNTCPICGHDKKNRHDACIASLPFVEYACCGHGNARDAYLCFGNTALYGPVALSVMRDLGGNPPELDKNEEEPESSIIVFTEDGMMETLYSVEKTHAISIEVDAD